MAFADSSETTLGFVPEASFGVTPATPAIQAFRLTGESLVYDIQNTTSQEIRDDAEITDLIQTGASASGDINWELSFGTEMDSLLEAALRGTFATNELKAATDTDSLTFEKVFKTGGTSQYLRFHGCRINTMAMNVQAQQIVTGSFGVMGLGGTHATTEITGTTRPAANTNPVMAAPDVATITIGGVGGTLYFTDLSFNINNNLRAQPAIGQIDSAGIGYGTREVTGQMTAYFENADLYTLFVNGTESSLSYDLADGTNTYTVTFPRIKYQTGQVTAGGQNQDVFAEMSWQALRDPTEQTSIKIDKS